MRATALVAVMAACVLSGCGSAEDGVFQRRARRARARYSGIGMYAAGRLWSQMAGVQAPTDPAAARLEDDEQIIVVVDSHTGEVRRCGDYSGVCVSMNPWADQGTRTAAPVKLTKHAADLDADDQARAREAASATEEATPAR